MKKFQLCGIIVLILLSFITNASADWIVDNGHKMHYPQLPDTEGWDVNATIPIAVADDWTCSETGWIKDIHFWGGWQSNQIGTINAFIVRIYSDIPANPPLIEYSRPGDILWETVVEDFIIADPVDPPLMAGWYAPEIGVNLPNDHIPYFQYNIFLDEPDWFWQEQGVVYWLEISAVVDNQQTRWGWRSSLDHYLDDGVFGTFGSTCIMPDNGGGTIDLPADCPYFSDIETINIIDGLPPGSEINAVPTLDNFTNIVVNPGGTLGGEIVTFDATLRLEMQGSGALAGYTRNINLPVTVEFHTAARIPGSPVQIFETSLIELEGQIIGDPDFDLLILHAGQSFGLPCPGEIEIIKLPDGDYRVDSFFDITYEIQFVGAPGSMLNGLSGTTTAAVHLDQGGQSMVISGDCIAPDNGSGTADLHIFCPYTAPTDNMQIIDGLPPGTTIECDPIIDNYINYMAGPGGLLGGEAEFFDATIQLNMTGTGDLGGFSRTVVIPIEVQTHSAPRNPGDPVQNFITDVFELTGGLFGDPDFDLLNVTVGTSYGLPSPGICVLTELPDGNYNVDSFFDITYEIQFVGAPGSALSGFSGSTTGTVRIEQGSDAGEGWAELYEPPAFQVSMDMSFVVNNYVPQPPCQGLCGDANNDGKVNVSDAVFIINYVFTGGFAPYAALACGDANSDGHVNVSDAVYIIGFVFTGGASPNDCAPGSPQWIDGDCCPYVPR